MDMDPGEAAMVCDQAGWRQRERMRSVTGDEQGRRQSWQAAGCRDAP
jgi:hypothetical protein